MSTATRLQELIARDGIVPGEIAALLDPLSHGERMEAVASLQGPKLQRQLWAIGDRNPRVTIEQLIPPDARPLREVIFHGKNSLPAFTRFQKRFCRPPRERGRDELWGYNHTNIGWLVGPGYFIAHDDPVGAAIDYRAVPPQGAPGWPAVRSNASGVSHLVYKNMIDYLRRIAEHVFIGEATKNGKGFDSYFVLCREP